MINFTDVFAVPDDLTPEEQQELENIRRRKQELLEDIQVKLTPINFDNFILQKNSTTSPFA